jgi:hypothetical protein
MRRHLTGGLWIAGTPVRQALLVLIAINRVTLSGLLGGRCRFYPTCSAYAEEAIRHWGAVRGLGLTLWRVLRCTPLSKGGVDYPPRVPARVSGGPLYDDDIQRSLDGSAGVREEARP